MQTLLWRLQNLSMPACHCTTVQCGCNTSADDACKLALPLLSVTVLLRLRASSYDAVLPCRKFADKSRASKEQLRNAENQHEMATGDTGLFTLINSRLGDQAPHQRHGHRGHPSGPIPQQPHHPQATARQSKFADGSTAPDVPRPQDRKSLIAHQASCFVCDIKASWIHLECERKREKSTPLGVITGTSVPRSSPSSHGKHHCMHDRCLVNVAVGLGLLLGTEAPIMTPNGVDFVFLFLLLMSVS